MPFTLAHPALVLPVYFLRKECFSLTGLVIGGMVPDIKFLIDNYDIRISSHNFWGAIWLDVPISILLCFIFHNIVRVPFIHYSPMIIKTRVQKFQTFDWNEYFLKYWATILISIVIGIYSHLIWDRFTHISEVFLSSITWGNKDDIFTKHPWLRYRLIQSFYSILGLTAEACFIWRMPASSNLIYKANTANYWWVVFGLSSITYLLFNLQELLTIEEVLTTAIAAVCIGLVLTSLFFRKNTSEATA
jgi:hypothetical protein